MAELSRYELGARRRVMTHYYGDGRWGEKRSGTYQFGDYSFTKTRPRTKRWAIGDGRHGSKPKKIHAIKFQVRDDLTGITLTVWRCGMNTFAKVRIVKDPAEVCAKCLDSFDPSPTTVRIR